MKCLVVTLFMNVKTFKYKIKRYIKQRKIVTETETCSSIRKLELSNTMRYTLVLTYKKLSYRRWTARCVVSVKILPIATLQCRNYLYDKS